MPHDFQQEKMKMAKLILYKDQDETLWDQELIAKGAISSQGITQELTFQNIIWKPPLPIGIPLRKIQKKNGRISYSSIINLLQIEYSPIAALNRTYALSKANGKAEAIWKQRNYI